MDTVETIGKIRDYIKQKGFEYDYGIIESFFLALKSKPYVIISGRSGSGKTSLVRLFAESIGATAENGRYKQITPESDWCSSARLLGHVNYDGKYVPGIIISFIQEAISNPEYPYFLCIDEMNIARPEQYMGKLLSVMETRRFNEEGRIVTDSVFDKSDFGIDLSASFSYDSLYLPDNLYIAGTVNVNESSYPLTTKIVDRMFVIDIGASKLASKIDFSDGENVHKASPIADVENEFLKSEYITLNDCTDDRDFLPEYSFWIHRMNQYIYHMPFSLSYRTRDEILFYAVYARKFDVFDRYTMDDFVIMQRMLPRVYGSGKSIKMCLSNLFKICMSNENANIDEYTENSAQMYIALKNYKPRYLCSAEKIIFMVRRLEEDGYTSFWQ